MKYVTTLFRKQQQQTNTQQTDMYSCLIRDGKKTVFVRVPGHVGINGKSAADSAAKNALDHDVSDEHFPFSDLKPRLKKKKKKGAETHRADNYFTLHFVEFETVTSFKHLSSVITVEGSTPEILSRIAQTAAALTISLE